MSPTEYTRYKVMVQMVNVLEWPTYCITRCKDEQCRALWRHWPSSAGVQPIFRNRTISWRHWPSFGITPYHDVTDRVTQVSDRLLTSRHTMTSYRDVTDRVTQVSDPFSENDPFSEIAINRPSCTSESPHLSGTVTMMVIGSFERESFRLVEFSKRVSHWSMLSVFYNVRN